jgi:voltage-gated potassium channel
MAAMSPTSTPTQTSPDAQRFGRPLSGWRLRIYTIIFEADTRAGRLFDLLLIAFILASVTVVMLDSIAPIHAQLREMVHYVLEWTFTAVFTLEYLARLACVRQPHSVCAQLFRGDRFGGVLLPAYLAIFFPGLHALIDVRILRLLRLFRILKLGAYVQEFAALGRALGASRRKITVFLSFVLMVVLIMGTLMYVVEGPAHGFTSIPTSVYWAITTMTTVGFGDITPKTDLGRAIASLMMLMGWGTLAVPTGIVSAEFVAQKTPREMTTRTCHHCLSEGHGPSDRFCRDCGAALPLWFRDGV